MARAVLFFAVCGLMSSRANADLPQLRGQRLLRLVEGNGKALQGDCFSPQFAARNEGLFFLRGEMNGVRSLWFASPLERPTERYPAWRAVPLLRSSKTLQLSEATSLRGDKALFLTIGAGDKQPYASQLARTEVGKKLKITPLWTGRDRLSQLALSPNGSTVVFTRYLRDLQGRETPQLWRIASDAREPKPLLVAKSARRALWLDDSTLVFERLVGSETAFYSLNPFTTEQPRFLLRGSGEGTSMGAGQGVIFAANPARSNTTSLFVLSRDGSGLRAVVGTEGARHPSVARDGGKLAYDAPNPQNGVRALWMATLTPPQQPLAALHAPKSSGARSLLCQIEPMPLPPPADGEGNGEQPVPTSAPAPAPEPRPTAVPRPNADKADMDVAGTLANVAVNGKMNVTFWAKNRGKRDWNPDDVRVVIRWVDFDSGGRRRWEYKWIKAKVPPLGQFRLPMEITAPNKPGRYKIIYSLMPLPSKGATITPPPYDASQDQWPGEFAATAFAVNVN